MVSSFFSMLAGIIAVIVSTIRGNKYASATEKKLEENKSIIKHFEKNVANRELWKEYEQKEVDEEFANMVSQKYEEVVRELKLPEDKWLSKKYRRIFSFRVYMASIGKLDPETAWYHALPIPNHYCNDYCDHHDEAKLYKWIDKTINKFYPQYYVIRVNESGTYWCRWNLNVFDVGTPISELSDDEVLKQFANE